ncbi:ROK family protein [Photobacterium sp. DNB23_23_1]|uniref:ROK family transcriptional regulator n=1 Tax=Photobacterium pectinilyticum TaxID=2906793 RepID=A0ABT1N041_9GAMM|nr:ROK family transcriptional regulator [Photobacterium sp. ZSDE20]MCQ1058108.1 ROK family transcriptional regulator [Photobacterium sp. ZSDE20]MDD1822641.1 ROK family transcriptional regulator [Photobacterium sp. ZSDE20]
MPTHLKELTTEQGISPKHIRQFNRRQILKLLYHYKGLSKSELAKLTQLSIPAVTNILASLLQDNWIEQHHVINATRGNHKGIFRVSKNQHDTVCVYISPKQLRAIVADNEIRPISNLFVHSISPDTPEAMLESIIAIIVAARQAAGQRPYRLALACHGQVDTKSGASLQMSQAPWSGSVEFKYLLEQRLNVDVLIDNDCVMIALAEKWQGSNLENDYCILNIDYGIGSSFLIGNDIYRGKHFGSGQIGHTTISLNGEMCGCGRRGCLETLASLKAIEQSYNNMSQQQAVSFDTILKRYHAGDSLAERIMQQAAKAIGQTLYNFLVTLDINQIILYGSTCQFGEKWLETITSQTLTNPFESDSSLSREQTQIRFGMLTDEQLLLGICYLWVEKELDSLM